MKGAPLFCFVTARGGATSEDDLIAKFSPHPANGNRVHRILLAAR
jgi:hypothetical protein